MSYVIRLLAAAAGTIFFSLSMRIPRRAIPVTALLASVGYTVYLILSNIAGAEVLGYFLASALIALGSEIAATLMKMPAMIFMFPGVIPLVPGISIYRTLLLLVQKEYIGFMELGTKTLFALGAMAVGIALVNEVARRVHMAKKKKLSATRS